MSPAIVWFALRGATLALTWFCLANLTASLLVAVAARPLARSAGTRMPELWFGLRIFAAAIATAFVAAIFLPSYLRYEPRYINEGFDLLLTAVAAITVAAVVAAAARGVLAWRSAARRTRAWMQTARPIALSGTSIPAYEIDVEAPVLALVGVLRPRLLVTRGLLAALTPEELAASLAHELEHSRAWDNLKRLAMRSTPDILVRSAAMRAIEEQWVIASEHGADRLACDHDPRARCALASALVKVAKLTPRTPPLAEPISTLVGGGDVASRVRRLLEDRISTGAASLPRAAGWIALLALMAGLFIIYNPLLRGVHEATEILVRSLP